jgi:hypothetical protein
MNEMQFFVNRKKEFESIGFFLLKIGVFFYILSLFYSDFIVEVLAFLRLLGIFYLYLARSLKWKFYFLVILGVYLVESINSTIFINVIILLILVYFIFNLNKVVSKIKLLAFSSVVFILIVVMQSTKGDFRSLSWVEGNTIDYSFGEMYLNSITNLNTDNFKSMAQNLNHRVNHGAIISQGMNHLDVKENLNFLKSEIIGILLPRFIYADKAVVGSHDKFEYFTGTKLNDGVAFNVGIFGDAYLALGPVIGIIFVFLVGFLFSLVYANYSYNLNKYPDLIVWSILIFFMVMRAGNEFYIIFNWIVKTGFFTVFFLKLIRPYFIKE